MDIKEIKRLIAVVEEANISHFSIEENDCKIKIKKELPSSSQVTTSVVMPQAAIPAAPVNAVAAAPAVSVPEAQVSDETSGLTPVNAQMVGTFYSASNPESAPFVKVGDKVSKGQVICIIEAMKLFNEIESDVDGVVEKICVENGDSVEFGQPLFFVK